MQSHFRRLLLDNDQALLNRRSLWSAAVGAALVFLPDTQTLIRVDPQRIFVVSILYLSTEYQSGAAVAVLKGFAYLVTLQIAVLFVLTLLQLLRRTHVI